MSQAPEQPKGSAAVDADRQVGNGPAPRVSVIIPTYNYGHYIREAIASVQAQSLTSWECIVVDDGSTDGTRGLVERLAAMDSRIIYHSQAQAGVSAARNVGLRIAKGELVQFLDADDLLSPAKLVTHAQLLRPQAATDIVYGPTRYFDDRPPNATRSGLHDRAFPPGAGSEGPDHAMLPRLLEANMMTVSAPLVRRSLLLRVGGFDERLERMEDWDLWLRCAIGGARFKFASDADAVDLVRVHHTSVSASVAPMLMSEIDVRRRVDDRLTRSADRALNRRRLGEVRSHAAKVVGLGGRPSMGLRILLPAIVSRRPRGLRTGARLVWELTGVPRIVRDFRVRPRRGGLRR